MKSVFIPKYKNGFSVIEGQLHEVQVKRVVIYYTEQGRKDTLMVSHRGGTKLYTVDGKNFYSTTDDFEQGLSVEFTREVYLSTYLKGEFSDGATYVWVFEGGEPVRKAIDFTEIVVKLDDKISITSPDLPDVTYSSRAECLSLNDYTVRLEDGTIKVVQGVINLCTLTKEQRALVDEMEALFKKAVDMGIRFAQDYSSSYAFNSNGLKNYAIDYGTAYTANEDGKMVNYELVDLSNSRFKCPFPIGYVCGDEDNLFILRKDD